MIQSIKRTFMILDYIAANGNLVRLNDIAEAIGLQNTTVYNLLKTLKELGYVEQDELTPRYRITPKISELYVPEKPLYQLKKEMKPILQNISDEIGETAYLAIQLGSYFRYELVSEPHRSIRISLEINKEEEMRHTAIGKIFMAYSPHLPNVLSKSLDANMKVELKKELDSIISNGYALDLENYEKDLNCVALPYLHKGKILAVLGIAGPAFRFTKTEMKNAAEKINFYLKKM